MAQNEEDSFELVIAQVDLLTAKIDPESAPFTSKYLAIDKLVRHSTFAVFHSPPIFHSLRRGPSIGLSWLEIYSNCTL